MGDSFRGSALLDQPMASQERAAKVAGVALLFSTALVAYANFAIQSRLFVEGDVAQTAHNIVTHETSFRLVAVCYLFYSVGILGLLTALYVILRPVNQGLAFFAALSRFIYMITWVVIVLNFLGGLRLLSEGYLKVFEPSRLQALAKLYLTGWDAYYTGLLFWSLASTMCSWLWLKSRYVPRVLALLGFIASVWCIGCTIAYLIFPNFANTVNLWWFDSPMAVFEIVLSFLLLFKGLRVQTPTQNQ